MFRSLRPAQKPSQQAPQTPPHGGVRPPQGGVRPPQGGFIDSDDEEAAEEESGEEEDSGDEETGDEEEEQEEEETSSQEEEEDESGEEEEEEEEDSGEEDSGEEESEEGEEESDDEDEDLELDADDDEEDLGDDLAGIGPPSDSGSIELAADPSHMTKFGRPRKKSKVALSTVAEEEEEEDGAGDEGGGEEEEGEGEASDADSETNDEAFYKEHISDAEKSRALRVFEHVDVHGEGKISSTQFALALELLGQQERIEGVLGLFKERGKDMISPGTLTLSPHHTPCSSFFLLPFFVFVSLSGVSCIRVNAQHRECSPHHTPLPLSHRQLPMAPRENAS